MTGGKVRQYPYSVRLLHTSTPLRSVVRLFLDHFHTSKKCGTKDEKGKQGSCGQHWTFVVWSPYTKKNTDKLERVQRRATKLILKSDDPYDIRLKKLNLMSVEKRRSLADVTFLWQH